MMSTPIGTDLSVASRAPTVSVLFWSNAAVTAERGCTVAITIT